MATFVLPSTQNNYESDLVPNFAVGETANSIIGNALNNQIIGNQYDDFIFGGAGNDRLFGEGGNDVLSGGAGNDTLVGGAGDDELFGNTGNNVHAGGVGNDILNGGDGDDTFFFTLATDGLDTVSSFFGADPGNDQLVFTDVAVADFFFGVAADGVSLHITNTADAADGILDFGVIVEDYFLAGSPLGIVDAVFGTDGGFFI